MSIRREVNESPLARLLFVLAVLLPLAVLFLLPGGAPLHSGFWFWAILLACFWFMLSTVVGPKEPASEPQGPRMIHQDEQSADVREVMDVRIATEDLSGVRTFRGHLRESAAGAYAKLRQAFLNQATPMVQEDEELGASIILVPHTTEAGAAHRDARPWVPWLLFALTVVTTTWAGAAHQGIDILREPNRFTAGLPYSLGLMAILGVHELGHYFTARYHKMRVTPPYFIPVPFALGTFGAFIQMRSPTENRRALFDVAVAGPLAGLVVAIPALFVGLRSSTVLMGGVGSDTGIMGGTSVGSSVLFALLSKFSLGDSLEYGHILRLSPLAFAGWLGLFITALNLLPIGQLDGGHISHALFGRRLGDKIGSVALWTLLLLAVFFWPGLMMWAVIVFFIAGRSVPPLNDLTPLPRNRRWLGYAVFVILGLILAPLPHSLWSAAGIHCPYL